MAAALMIKLIGRVLSSVLFVLWEADDERAAVHGLHDLPDGPGTAMG